MWRYALVMVFGAVLGLIMAPSSAQAECRRDCPAAERDAYGCCKKRKPVKPCPNPGMSRTRLSKWKCCWPGQTWKNKACTGVPQSCPDGMSPNEQTLACEPAQCTDGRVRAQDKIHCCWPGQKWAKRKDQCVGKPKCPEGTTAKGDTCVGGALAGQVEIPGGAFTQGSSKNGMNLALKICQETYSEGQQCHMDWFRREGPQRSVELSTFYIDKYEVTNERYGACVADGQCKAIAYDKCTVLQADGSSWKVGGTPHADLIKPSHPAVCVTWAEAGNFCKWAGGRLPTEAEWEKAARGNKDDRLFPWGNQWSPASLNWGEMEGFGKEDSYETTAPVGSFPKNVSPYGAYDMSGNAWEWTADTFSNDFYGRAPKKDPFNNRGSSEKVVRGGSWSFAGNGAIVTYRYPMDPSTREDSFGFRCVSTPKGNKVDVVKDAEQFIPADVTARLQRSGWTIVKQAKDEQSNFTANHWAIKKGSQEGLVSRITLTDPSEGPDVAKALGTEQNAATTLRGRYILMVILPSRPGAEILLQSLAK